MSAVTMKGKPILVRQARLDDEEGLKRCKGGTPDHVRGQLEWTTASRGPGVLKHLVAEVEGVAVGTVMLMLKGAHAWVDESGAVQFCARRVDAATGRLDDWVVAGDHQRQGIGTALARAVIEEAGRWQLRRLESSSMNPAAVAALLGVGFVEYGRLPSIGDSNRAEVLVYRDL